MVQNGNNDIIAYKKYLLKPLNMMYKKMWCVILGRSLVSPHPHRYYTYTEFVYISKHKEEIYNSFYE